jgi:hypothetical protein
MGEPLVVGIIDHWEGTLINGEWRENERVENRGREDA